VVPFHLWTPDVYEGAPAPVTAFIATVSKGGVFAVVLRYFYETETAAAGPVWTVFAIIAVGSMAAGTLLALLQDNVKRILAYSSIAHFGFLLVAFLVGGEMGATAATFYLAAYFVTTLGAFGVIGALSGSERDADHIADYHGLFWRRPWLSGTMSAMLFSLAGIPLTAGFVGKFYVLAAGASAAMWGLLIVMVVSSAVGLYYYLRIMVYMYATEEEAPGEQVAALPPAPAGLTAGVALTVLTVLLLWLGVFPGGLFEAIATAVGALP
jgi:NADH-quinone oxidoreductase subunit N